MPSLKIEVAGIDDVNAYRDLRLQALATNPSSYLDNFMEEYERTTGDWVTKVLKQNGSVLLGYTDVDPNIAIGTQAVNVAKGQALLHGLYVLPKYRGSGYGIDLIMAGLSHARNQGATHAKSHVLYGNERSVTLLESCGFNVDTVTLVDRKRYGKMFGEYTLSKTLA